MNATTKPEAEALKPNGLALLRAPVPEHLISPLPKPTKEQNDRDKTGHMWIRCKLCGGWHHPQVTHLSYVGHAAATHLLLDADPMWSWEPASWTSDGLPCFDKSGGLWIKLTVCGVTRLGYGHAKAKTGAEEGSREKEVIGDAIRNAAMRFGLALELWSKADIHAGSESEREEWRLACISRIHAAANVGELKTVMAAVAAEAATRDDKEAAEDFLIAQADKMARAKKTPAAPATQPKRSAEDDLSDADIPH